MTYGQMTIFQCIKNRQDDKSDAGKDAYYGIKNNPKTDWRKLLELQCFFGLNGVSTCKKNNQRDNVFYC